MFRNFLKTTFRNLLKNKTYSFLNIFGLATGIACASMIFLWVEDEISYDDFHKKKDRLFFVKINSKIDAGVFTHSSTPGVMGPALKAEIAGIENTCRITETPTSLLFNVEGKPIYASGRFAEASLFDMFTLPFAEGNAKNALSQLHSLVITEKTAKKLFGEEKNVIGKKVLVDNKQEYTITGVLKDLSENSTLEFEWIAPFEIYYQQSPWAQKWESSCLSTYVELANGVSEESVNKQLHGFMQTKVPESLNRPFLFSMNDWRLYDQFDNGKQTGGGRIEYVRLFSAIAWIVLFIACINFMNLATARSEKRAREVGVRKVLGAGKRRLAFQFIGEAIIMSLLATLLSLLIMFLILPVFNTLMQKNLELGLNNPLHIIALLSITVICGLISGSYPSIYLSSFIPIFVLKGIKLRTASAAFIRKGLVVVQFTVSIVLIIGTIIIYKQIQHVKQRNLGFKKDNLIEINLQGNMLKSFSSIKQDLLSTGSVENAAVIDRGTLYGGNNTTDIWWAGKAPNSEIVISQRLVSPEYISTVGMEIKDGRDFQATDKVKINEDFELKNPDAFINIIVTESFEKLLGTGSVLGKIVHVPGRKESVLNLRVVGVVKDYLYGNMYGKPDPVVFTCIPQFASVMYLRLNANANTEQALAQVGKVIKKHNPAYPFEYRFVDDQFNGMFLNEMLMSKLSRVFAGLAIVISCLGLFGLAAYTAESRIKEIGIRKVLGASVTGIAGLLSKDFIKLVIISGFIAFPLAWWFMNNWLEQYPYRIEISWWIFALAGLIAILIAVFTISFQAIKAAVANPVKSLRTE